MSEKKLQKSLFFWQQKWMYILVYFFYFANLYIPWVVEFFFYDIVGNHVSTRVTTYLASCQK